MNYSNFLILALVLTVLLVTGCMQQSSMDQFPAASQPYTSHDLLPPFPWPVPTASDYYIVPTDLLIRSEFERTTLYDISQKLEAAFDKAGYHSIRYFSVPNGFSIVSRLEQIDSEGNSINDIQRWSLSPEICEAFDIACFLEKLFQADPGFFRVIVFVVTDHKIDESRELIVTPDTAYAWLQRGSLYLPRYEFSEIEFNQGYRCTVLIYELERPDRTATPSIALPGRLQAKTHLNRSQILSALSE